MTENPNTPPVKPPEPPVDTEDHQEAVPPPVSAVPPEVPPEAPAVPVETPVATEDPERMGERLERLGGEPAPAITPEEFARLQRAGQVHIDARGRVRTARRSDAEAGVSLRKRRAWYV